MKEGIILAKCDNCGIEVIAEDLYEDKGSMVCEDCKIKGSVSPSIPCGGEN